MTVSTEVNECRLKARLHTGNFGLVDVCLGLNALSIFYV